MKFAWKMKYTWFVVISIVTILSMIADFFIPAGEGEEQFWWSCIDGFFALLGFIGCVGIVMIAKWLGRYWLQRKEDYYD